MSCPICNGDTQQRYRPFCSRRCADRDLGKWLNGSYAVPSQRLDDIGGEADEPERERLRSH
ncbi:MAG: DNA gyrase inhibitor YacG [Sedimentitalea sp.]|uniref:DNA gyrase inhibitor YacG n=1 Tax=Sedimentitalea sp. TaxID=2048915 RepID=UPI0032648F86